MSRKTKIMEKDELLIALLEYLNSFGTTENFIDWAVNCELEKDEEELREAIRKTNEYDWD